ncbi:hypothetical protein L6452_23963 [Arctium lappa]|uniref:Uncharacterized protein n=1 Tax=Arctium lappa TaxID=4217 RepID=A0ACB9A9L3_ARCLA|nr:hypothetical protein L6452_23963 [Arctium lappa]
MLDKFVRPSCIITSSMFIAFQAMPAIERVKILLDITDALEANEKVIILEIEADVANAQDAGYETSLVSRLALKPRKASQLEFVFSLAKAIRVIANKEEPIGQVLKRTEMASLVVASFQKDDTPQMLFFCRRLENNVHLNINIPPTPT